MTEKIKLWNEFVKEKDVKNFEGMYYQGRKEGIDFLLCPRDGKSKCLNFKADPPKYPHAMDMYNDGGEKTFCRHCQTGAPKRGAKGRESIEIKKQKTRRLNNPGGGVFVGSTLVPFYARDPVGVECYARVPVDVKCYASTLKKKTKARKVA